MIMSILASFTRTLTTIVEAAYEAKAMRDAASHRYPGLMASE